MMLIIYTILVILVIITGGVLLGLVTHYLLNSWTL